MIANFVKGSHHDDHHVARRWITLHLSADFKSRHSRHHHIEQHEIGAIFLNRLYGLKPVTGRGEFAGKRLEVGEHEFKILLIVVYKQNLGV